MGTNYYLEAKPPCTCCGRPFERQHIGKSSAGWCFTLHVDENHRDLPDWVEEWSKPGAAIVDEYGDGVAGDEMLLIITARHWTDAPWETLPLPHGASWSTFHAQNQSEHGPNGLLRHRIDRHYCIAHGSGTWDLCTGEFS